MLFTPASAPSACVVIVPPLFEEKRCAHRALTMCARALAEAGAVVLHPDLTATGNSQGRLADITLDDWIDDIVEAVTVVTDRASAPVRITGCRAGALLAAHAVARGLTVDRLLLWQPIASGRGYLQQTRTRRMIQQHVVGKSTAEDDPYEVEGQQLSSDLYTVLESLTYPTARSLNDLRLLQCGATDRLLNEYQRLGAQLPFSSMRCVVCPPFWLPHTPASYTAVTEAVCQEVLA
jgi:hypothetical protein